MEDSICTQAATLGLHIGSSSLLFSAPILRVHFANEKQRRRCIQKARSVSLHALPHWRVSSNVSHLTGNVHEAQKSLQVAGHA